MPTGVHLRDPRDQLFSAAEHVLLHDGPDALTSRAVTARARCAKGVLHRHFASFDAFLAEFALDRIDRLRAGGDALRASAGTGTVAGNLTGALPGLFGPAAMRLVVRAAFHHQVRARLRAAGPVGGVPVLAEITAIVAAYLAAERDLGRLTADAGIAALARTLTGAAHLLFAGSDDPPPTAGAVREVVTIVLAGALPAAG
ncbi:TetR/AcrR family transcriptional regulator [Nonomuraea sp. NPDC004297]